MREGGGGIRCRMCEVKLLPKSSKHHVQLKPVPTLITFYPCAFSFYNLGVRTFMGVAITRSLCWGPHIFGKLPCPFATTCFLRTLKPVNVLSASLS